MRNLFIRLRTPLFSLNVEASELLSKLNQAVRLNSVQLTTL
jgi:hypothetical protein